MKWRWPWDPNPPDDVPDPHDERPYGPGNPLWEAQRLEAEMRELVRMAERAQRRSSAMLEGLRLFGDVLADRPGRHSWDPPK